MFRIYRYIGWVAILYFVIMQPTGCAWASPIKIMVCGEGQGQNAAKEAGENARYKAVKKALLQITAIDDNPKSIYQVILNQYMKFSSNLEVTKQNKTNDIVYLFGHVVVDIDAMQECMKRQIIEEKNIDSDTRTVYFFVRVNGLADVESEKIAEQLVLKRYGDTFQKIGFTTEDEDNSLRKMEEYRNLSYDNFSIGMKQYISSIPEVTLAIIGEINMNIKGQDSEGVTAASYMHMEIVDFFAQQKKIAEFNDTYEIRQNTVENARNFILEKSAFNSAKILGDQAQVYWKNEH